MTEIAGHTDTVTSVGFNFNGMQFLTGSYDGTVRIYNLETKELVVTLEGPEDIEWAKWHNRGNAVIAGSKDGTVWLWLSHNGQCMQVFTGNFHDLSKLLQIFQLNSSVLFPPLRSWWLDQLWWLHIRRQDDCHRS